MSDDFFRRYVDDLLGASAFRGRHPGFQVRLFPIDELAGVVIGELLGRDLRLYNKSLAALLRGDSVQRITVDIIDDEATLAEGAPVLQAARDAGATELWARVRYTSIAAEESTGETPPRSLATIESQPDPASDFSRRYIDELLSDPAFRARHPHFHIRLFPLDELAHLIVGELVGRDLRLYNKSLAALLRGDPVERIVVDIIDTLNEPVLFAGAPVLQAARDAGVTELWARVRYVSRTVERVWWNAPGLDGANVPEIEVLITEDEDPILTEAGDEIAA